MHYKYVYSAYSTDGDPGLRIESFAIETLCGVFHQTKNNYITLFIRHAKVKTFFVLTEE